jgi:PAS domain S-box-containing protein
MPALQPIDSALLLQALVGSTEYAVVAIGLEGTICGWTGAAPRLFGYAVEEALGKHYGVLFVEEDLALRLHDHEMELAATSGRSEDDRWHLRRDGTRFWGSGVLQALRTAEGKVTGYCKILRDRSDLRIRSEAQDTEIERLSAELRRRDETLITSIHELRSPLAPISAATELLKLPSNPEVTVKAVEVLTRQTDVLARHLNDLYEAAHALAEAPALRIEPVAVNRTLEGVVDDQRPLAEASSLDLRVVLPTAEILVEADPLRLQQMLQNLLSNAIKYTPPGGRVVVSATVEGADVSIRFEDTGIGIDPELLPRMFELFVREERPTHAAAPDGLGVGLALVKRFADLHGGTVEGRSLGHNRGSIFTLRLPLRQPQRALRKQRGE